MEKLEGLLQNEEFMGKVIKCNDKNEVVEIFKSYDYDISDKEFEDLKNFLQKVVAECSKMSEDELLDISGGKVEVNTLDDAADLMVTSGLGGSAIMGTAGSLYGAYKGYQWSKKSKSGIVGTATKMVGGALAYATAGTIGGAFFGGTAGGAGVVGVNILLKN